MAETEEFSLPPFLDSIRSLPELDYAPALDEILETSVRYEEVLRRDFASELLPEIADAFPLYVGLFDVFSLPEYARSARPRSWNDPLFEVSIDGDTIDTFPHKHLFLIPEMFRIQYGTLCTVPSYEHFLRQWNVFTNSAFSAISDWNNIIVAGGAVLASLLPMPDYFGRLEHPTRRELGEHYESFYRNADVDIFLYGLDEVRALARIEGLCKEIASNLPNRSIFIRRANTITIRTDGDTRPIQIVFRLYRSPGEILAGFDVDCSCCAFNGSEVYVNPRALIAIMRQCNTVDMTRRSPSYEVRLQKYAKRGFEVYLPSLQRHRIDYAEVYDPRQSRFPQGLARLLIYEYIRYNPTHFPQLRSSLYGRDHGRLSRQWFKSFLDFTPMNEDSAYDKVWARIPAEWGIDRASSHINAMNKAMNSPWKLTLYERTIHRHYITWSFEIDDILRRTACKVTLECPDPTTARDFSLLEEEKESGVYFRGPVTFITKNPGAQLLTGSFRPIDLDDWTAGVYFPEGQLRAVPTTWRRPYFTTWLGFSELGFP